MSDQTTTPQLAGVKHVELYKLVWSKIDRIALFVGLILLSWAINWETSLNLSLTTNVTGLFETNNLISMLSTILYILQSALYPIYSKLSDIYGRAACYSVALFFYILSYIVMACANNYYTLVGGQIIYAFGYTGVAILGPITIADFTNTVNRGLFQALYNVPSLINLFLAPRAGQELWDNGQWRWGYGQIPILIFVTALPLMVTHWKLFFKVKKSGLMEQQQQQQQPKKSIFEKIIWLLVEIDIVGSFFLVAGLAMILLPLVLALSTFGGWGSSKTIGTLIGGVVAWICFVIWEWKLAKKPIIPIFKWTTRTPLYGVCALSTVTIISSTNWQYFYLYLMLSRRVNSNTAILLERGYNVAYIVCELIVGIMMKRFRVWKPFVWSGVSLIILGVGLMIPARFPTSSDAFVVISQTVVGIGSGFLYTPMLVAIQSSVPHDDMAIATALMQVGGSIAASIGSTMAGSIWNNMLPGELAKRVPGEYDYAKIVGNVEYALALPTEQYEGVVSAYGHIQMVLSIISMCIAVLTFCFTLPMKSFGLENHQKENGDEQTDHSSSSSTKETEKTQVTEQIIPPSSEKL